LVLTNPEEIKNRNRLFEEKIVVIKRPYTIPSSNWANDFQEHLSLGKFLIVEIPFLTTSVNSIDDSTSEKVNGERQSKGVGMLSSLFLEGR
jgi:hypothetical protein